MDISVLLEDVHSCGGIPSAHWKMSSATGVPSILQRVGGAVSTVEFLQDCAECSVL